MSDRRPFPALGKRGITGQFGGVDVVATAVGVGTKAAVETAELLFRSAAVRRVLIVGIAGASARHLRVGDVVVPETVVDGPNDRSYASSPLGAAERKGTILTDDQLLSDPDAFAALHRRGITALDMETGAIAAVCDRHGVPWTAFRAISDNVDRPVDADVMTMLNRDGTANVGAAVKFIARRPWMIAHLVALARDSNRACDAAAAAAETALRSAGAA
jgi:adenosylhomocysteine nucleosidase